VDAWQPPPRVAGGSLPVGVALPLLAAALWAVFRVPNDPGPAPVAAPGPARLLLEAALFAGAVALLAIAGRQGLATVLAVLLVVDYAVDRERLVRLASGREPP
jgi:hypothetical protein